MLRVTVELVPHGYESRKETIGVMTIVNDGTGDQNTGNYDVTLSKDPRIAKKPGVWKRGRVLGFPRKLKGSFDLLFLALEACVASRNRGGGT